MAHFAQRFEAIHGRPPGRLLARLRARLFPKDEPSDQDIRRAWKRGYRWRWIREHYSALDRILCADGRVQDLRFRKPPYASRRMNAAFVEGANARLREAIGDRVAVTDQIYDRGAKGKADFEISVPLPPTLAADLGFGPHTTPHLTGRVCTGAKLATDRKSGARVLKSRPASFGDAELDQAYAAGLACFLAQTAGEDRAAPVESQRNEFRIAASLSAFAVLFGHWWS